MQAKEIVGNLQFNIEKLPGKVWRQWAADLASVGVGLEEWDTLGLSGALCGIFTKTAVQIVRLPAKPSARAQEKFRKESEKHVVVSI